MWNVLHKIADCPPSACACLWKNVARSEPASSGRKTFSSSSGGFAALRHCWNPVDADWDVSCGVTGAYQGAPCTLRLCLLCFLLVLF